MSSTSQADAILEQWERLREQGQTPVVEELCKHNPDLLPEVKWRIQAREAMESGPATETFDYRGKQPQSVLPDFPDYTVLEELGHGGMGVVYKARHSQLGRWVALKMIRAGEIASRDDIERFRSEAKAAARLHHPGIVQIYDIGISRGMPFLVLEFVDGKDLRSRLGGSPQEPRWAAELVAELARAMHVAHCAHVIHRDLKPANILLTAQGKPKISDFGLAKIVDSESLHTRTGQVLGTPSYMAPEQASGSGAQVGPAADVYALGAILYEALTGQPPFRGATAMQTIQQVLTKAPTPPSRLQASTPHDLQAICLRCLAKKPERRFATALDLADALDRWLTEQPSQPERRRRLVYTSAIIALAAGVALAVALYTFFPRPSPVVSETAKPSAKINPGPATNIPEKAPPVKIEKPAPPKPADEEPIVLIGAAGPPGAGARYIAGQNSLRDSLKSGAVFEMASSGECLLELRTTAPWPSYRYEAEVRQELDTDGGRAGLFFGRGEHHHDGERYGFLGCWLFSDQGAFGGKAIMILQASRTQQTPRGATSQTSAYKYFPTVPQAWRKLAVVVTPVVVRTFWEGELVRELPRAKLDAQARNIFLLPKTFPPEPVLGDSLGLYVTHGKAAFRNVVVRRE